jgi:hypothetical protein
MYAVAAPVGEVVDLQLGEVPVRIAVDGATS